MLFRVFAAALLASLAACQPSVPESPTWFQDIQPIVMANCAGCHGADPGRPEISTFRLDRYVKNDPTTLDAYDYAQAIVRSAARLEAPAMPPTYALSERQRATLERWLEQGAPKGQRENRLPRAEQLAPLESSLTVDQSLALTLRSWDEDGDGLAVLVGLREPGSAAALTRLTTGAGIRDVTLDTGALPSGKTYELFAVLDDGFFDDPVANAHEVVLMPSVAVDHGTRGTAPAVQLIRPNGGETLIGSAEIAWVASDPDTGDTVSIDLELIEVAPDGSGNRVATIASALPNVPSSYTWDVSSVPPSRGGQPIPYRVRVVARDAGGINVRSDDSDAPFTVATSVASTSYTWTDVRPVFVTYCRSCHGEPAYTPALESFRLDKYDASDPVAPVNADPGVYEMRARVYDRMVSQKNMPPANSLQPSAAEIAMIGEWIRAGAPKGPGQQNAPPTFSWNVPNDVAISTASSTGTVTLSWTASDPEGQPFSSASLSYARLSATVDLLAVCDTSVSAWTTIAGADVTAGSYVFTLPSTGYFCFRGQVTDAAGQTTTTVAGRPVKYAPSPRP
jgi:cytochrome c553